MKKIVLAIAAVVSTSISLTMGQIRVIGSQSFQMEYTFPTYQKSIPNDQISLKSPQKAFLISLGHFAIPTLVGTLLLSGDNNRTESLGGIIMLYGIGVGPSMGNFYARDAARGWGGLIVRFLGGGIMLAGAATGTHEIWSNALNNDKHSDSEGIALFAAGALICTGGVIFNLATAGRSADDYNKKHSAANLSMAPVYYPKQRVPGLALSVRF